MNELKPCPFCGKKPKLLESYAKPNGKEAYFKFLIGCPKCNVHFSYARVYFQLTDNLEIKVSFDEREKAIEAWNRRTTE